MVGFFFEIIGLVKFDAERSGDSGLDKSGRNTLLHNDLKFLGQTIGGLGNITFVLGIFSFEGFKNYI